MRWYLATIPIFALVISGCASEGGGATKPIAGADKGPGAPAADATPGATVGHATPGARVAGAARKTTVAGAGPAPSGAGAAPGVPVGPVAYQKNRTPGALVGAVGGGLTSGAVSPYM